MRQQHAVPAAALNPSIPPDSIDQIVSSLFSHPLSASPCVALPSLACFKLFPTHLDPRSQGTRSEVHVSGVHAHHMFPLLVNDGQLPPRCSDAIRLTSL